MEKKRKLSKQHHFADVAPCALCIIVLFNQFFYLFTYFLRSTFFKQTNKTTLRPYLYGPLLT